MKNVFTYPNNSSTNYVDPDYAGIPTQTYTTSDVPLNTPVIIKTIGDTDFSIYTRRFNGYGANNTVLTRSLRVGWEDDPGKVIVFVDRPTGTATFEEAEGMYRRTAALLDGTYKDILSTYPTTTINETMTAMSQFANYIDSENGANNVSLDSFWYHPLATFDSRSGGYSINNLSTVLDGDADLGVMRLDATSDVDTNGGHIIQDGDPLELTDFVDDTIPWSNLNGVTAYCKRVDHRKVDLFADQALTTPLEVTGVYNNQDDWHIIGDNGGTIVFFDTPTDETFSDGQKMIVAQAMETVTGTCNPSQGGELYLDQISTNVYKLYTNSGLTTDATLTNEVNFGTTLSVTIGAAQTTTLEEISAVYSELKTFLNDSTKHLLDTNLNIGGDVYKWGFCRMKHEVQNSHDYTGVAQSSTSGSGTSATFDVSRLGSSYDVVTVNGAGSGYAVNDTVTILGTSLDGATTANDLTITVTTVDGSGGITGITHSGTAAVATYSSTKAAPTSIDDTKYYLWMYDDTNEEVYIYNEFDPSGGGKPDYTTLHQFTTGGNLAQSGDKVVVTMSFIDMVNQKADDNGGSGVWWYEVDADLSNGKYGLERNYYNGAWLNVIKAPKLHSYGHTTYKKRTGASTYEFDLEMPSRVWAAGATSARTLGAGEVMPDNRFTGDDSSGYITGFSTPTEEAHRGALTTSGTMTFEYDVAPDTYTPPAATTASLEDNFDTDDEFGDTGFNDGLKKWPDYTHTNYKGPRTIAWRYSTPNALTESQNGTVFVRSSGRQKLYLDVNYPPLTEEQFAPMLRFAQAVQGEYNPFQFVLRGNNDFRYLANTGTETAYAIRTNQQVSAGSSVTTIEGFPSNQSDAFKAGEPIIMPDSSSDGDIKFVINQVDANVFGEARIRLQSPLNTVNLGTQVYKDPFSIVVTLDQNNFNWSRDLDGYYRVSVTFKADKFKGA